LLASCTPRLPYHFLEDTCAENPPSAGGSSFRQRVEFPAEAPPN
jgi:hypothetical protein